MMKDQPVADRRRNWPVGGKTGRLSILLISIILGPRARHARESAKLHALFPSSLDILDEMSSIRRVEHANRARLMAPFAGKRLDAREVFDFAVPEGCAPTYESRQRPVRKRGRPPRKRVENS